MGECGGLDGFPFWLQASSSETTSNKESVIVNHVIPAYTLRQKRERLKQYQLKQFQFSHDALAL